MGRTLRHLCSAPRNCQQVRFCSLNAIPNVYLGRLRRISPIMDRVSVSQSPTCSDVQNVDSGENWEWTDLEERIDFPFIGSVKRVTKSVCDIRTASADLCGYIPYRAQRTSSHMSCLKRGHGGATYEIHSKRKAATEGTCTTAKEEAWSSSKHINTRYHKIYHTDNFWGP